MDVVSLLQEYNISFEQKPNDKLEVLCPFHNDNNPSGTFDIVKGTFNCWSCKKVTNIHAYLAKKLGKSPKTVYHELNKRFDNGNDILSNPQDIERYHQRIWEHDLYLKELLDRQVDEELIRHYRIGIQADRIAIPIQNAAGNFVNIRLYKPGASKAKFLNLKGKTQKKVRLYPIEQLIYDNILLVGGEIKAIAAAKVLNPHNIGVITTTCGENIWPSDLTCYFENKTVYICLDIDEAGEKGAELRCRELQNVTQWIGKIVLPLNIEKHPKGDINDYLREGGDLLKLIEDCEKWIRDDTKELDDDGSILDIDLNAAVSAKYTGKRIGYEAIVSSIDDKPYTIPKTFNIKCPRGQNFCNNCAITSMEKEKQEYTLQSERLEIIEMVGVDRIHHKRILKGAVGIPHQCMECEFEIIESYSVNDTRISEKLDLTSQSIERTMQMAYCVGESRLELNDSYKMKGRMYPHPKNQQATILVSEYEPTEDALSSYKPENLDRLAIFQPNEWDENGIKEKLDSIYSDLEANVSHIYKRRALHLAVDLCYHSPLYIPINGIPINGWTEVLIVGDSAQGKSETSKLLKEFYGLGERVICKGATVAGLLGGVAQQGNKRWFVSWGKIPSNDRRLVILEEMKGMQVEVIAALTDMRSSGVAEITKIEARTAKARTRLLGISNPRSQRYLSAFNFGIDAIKELIGNLEDIRRWDMCLLVGREEVDEDEISSLQKKPPIRDHIYTSELCRELILWAWTTTVEFENQSTLFDISLALCKEFTDDIPIIDRFSMKNKLAKLSAALAARTFSTNGSTILIRDCHINYIAKFLREVYSSDMFGYARYSEIAKQSEKLVNEKIIIQRLKDRVKHSEDLVSHLLITEEINVEWIQDLVGWPQEESRGLLSFLRRQRALKPTSKRGYYRKTASFTELLRRIVENNILDTKKPGYLKDVEEKEDF